MRLWAALNSTTPAPDDLPEEGKTLWNTLEPKLRKEGRLIDDDLSAFEVLCLQFGLIKQAEKQLKEDGMTTPGSKGQLVRHPAVDILNQASMSFWRFGVHFGLTPKTRGDVEADPLQDDEVTSLLD